MWMAETLAGRLAYARALECFNQAISSSTCLFQDEVTGAFCHSFQMLGVLAASELHVVVVCVCFGTAHEAAVLCW